MGKARPPEPVRWFCGVLASDGDAWKEIRPVMEARLGPVDVETPWKPFEWTSYYDEEMGKPIWRKWVSFAHLEDPASLASVKHWTNTLERDVRARHPSGRRVLNLDPGWVNLHQVVLASTKATGYRIYLDRGIYAELTLWFHDRRWHPLPWTYPDYRTPEALEFFHRVRILYKNQRRQWVSSRA